VPTPHANHHLALKGNYTLVFWSIVLCRTLQVSLMMHCSHPNQPNVIALHLSVTPTMHICCPCTNFSSSRLCKGEKQAELS